MHCVVILSSNSILQVYFTPNDINIRQLCRGFIVWITLKEVKIFFFFFLAEVNQLLFWEHTCGAFM